MNRPRLGHLALAALLAACSRPSDATADAPEPAPAAPALAVEPDATATASATPSPAQTDDGIAPVTRGQGSCIVSVVAVLEAEDYRGPGPLTPAVAASLDADPASARTYKRLSHGDHHIQCHYEVHLDDRPGQRFRWRVVHGNTLREHTPAICSDPAELAAVAEDIIRTTEDCTQLDAGSYWGYVLEPL